MNGPVDILTKRWRSQRAATKFLIFPVADDRLHIPVPVPLDSSHHVEQMACGRLIEIDDSTPFGIIVRSTGVGSERLCWECARINVAQSS